MPHRVSRRAFLAASGAGAAHAAAGATGRLEHDASRFRIGEMLVDGVANPMGVHGVRHRLSWQLLAAGNRARQAAYRVGVASSEEGARSGAFDLWDSGRIASALCFDIAYEGRPLGSRERAWWVVTCWDEAGRPATSAIARWEMGLLEAKDWTGRWIAAEDAAARADREAGFFWLMGPAGGVRTNRSFRIAFDLPAPARAAIFVGMSGKAEVRVNGAALALPPYNPLSWGAPQPAMVETDLAAGRHVVIVNVPGYPEPKAALLVRATLADGRGIHVNGLEAETITGKPGDWGAPPTPGDGWIAANVLTDPPAPLPAGPAYLLRRVFEVRGAIASARLYVTALGVYEAELNGARLGDAVLTPEFTDYRKRALYAAHDVTQQLRQGVNVLGGMVGEGWYGSNIAPGGRYSFGPAPLRYRAQLEITYADGRRQVVGGDDQWRIARAPITASGIYDGEDYDARLEIAGWSAPDNGASAPLWQPAALAPDVPTACRLVGAVAPAIRRMARLAPKRVTQLEPGRYVADFGQNFAGWVRLRLKGEAGQQVTLRFAELAKDDGGVDQSNLRGARAADRYTMRGDPAGESFEPRFTYHGFRYVEIAGLTAAPAAGDIEGVVIHSSLVETGELALGQYVPQRLWQNALWSQRSNFMGIPTDCPQRDERLGWMGDAHVFWDAAAYNMDVAAFTARFMGDVEDAQRADGGYADIAPDASGGSFTPAGSSPGWGDAGVMLPWTVWWRYGDTGIVDRHWDSMRRFMESILRANPELIWSRERGSDYGDWLALDAKRPGDPTTPKDLVGTAMWKASADAMAQMAAATGRAADAVAYRALADGLARAFARAFVNSDGVVGNGSQTGAIQALHFDLIPAGLRDAARRHLVDDIVRRGNLLSSGFLGTPYSLDVLADAGESRLVYDLLLRTAYPSWGYMIAHDATTIWERWNGDTGSKAMNSFNHYALGAVAGFMYRRIAGIDATAPGFARFRVDPIYDPRLKAGGGRYQSRSGWITTRWEWDARRGYRLDVDVPPNSQATVVLPARTLDQVRRGARPLAASDLARTTAAAGDKLTLQLEPGKYGFHIPRAKFAKDDLEANAFGWIGE